MEWAGVSFNYELSTSTHLLWHVPPHPNILDLPLVIQPIPFHSYTWQATDCLFNTQDYTSLQYSKLQQSTTVSKQDTTS